MGIMKHASLGKVRHIAVQEAALKAKHFSVQKVSGIDNPADILTKFLGKTGIEKHSAAAGLVRRDGRSKPKGFERPAAPAATARTAP